MPDKGNKCPGVAVLVAGGQRGVREIEIPLEISVGRYEFHSVRQVPAEFGVCLESAVACELCIGQVTATRIGGSDGKHRAAAGFCADRTAGAFAVWIGGGLRKRK